MLLEAREETSTSYQLLTSGDRNAQERQEDALLIKHDRQMVCFVLMLLDVYFVIFFGCEKSLSICVAALILALHGAYSTLYKYIEQRVLKYFYLVEQARPQATYQYEYYYRRLLRMYQSTSTTSNTECEVTYLSVK